MNNDIKKMVDAVISGDDEAADAALAQVLKDKIAHALVAANKPEQTTDQASE